MLAHDGPDCLELTRGRRTSDIGGVLVTWSLVGGLLLSAASFSALHAAEKPVPPSPADKLNPERIPVAERLSWQPKELVALLGSQRGFLPGPVRSVAYGGDGQRLASVGDRSLILWDAADLREVASFVCSLAALTPDGKTLATGEMSSDEVQMRDLRGERPRKRAPLKLPGTFSALALSADGKLLAIKSGDSGSFSVWDLGGAAPKQLAEVRKGVSCLVFAPDSKTLAVGIGGDTNDTAELWEVTEGKVRLKAALTGDRRQLVEAIAFSPDGNALALGGSDLLKQTPPTMWLRLWTLGDGAPKEKTRLASQDGWLEGSLVGLAFSGDGKVLVTAKGSHSADRRGGPPSYYTSEDSGDPLVAWDLTGDKPKVRAWVPAGGFVTAVAFAPNRSTVAVGLMSGQVRQWDLDGGKFRARLSLPRCWGPLAFSPDGKALVTGRQLWTLGEDRPRERVAFGKHAARVEAVAYSPDSRTLAWSGRRASDGKDGLWFWDVEGDKPREGDPLRSRATHDRPLLFSPDGKTLAVAAWRCYLWDLSRPEPKQRAEIKGKSEVTALAFAPDGASLLIGGGTATNSGWLQLWDVSGEQPRQRSDLEKLLTSRSGLAGGPRGLSSVLFVSGGKQLALANNYGEVSLCDVGQDKAAARADREDNHAPSGADPRFEYAQVWLAAPPGGETLISAGDDGKIVLRELASLKPIKKWQWSQTLRGIALAPDGRHLAAANADGSVYILRLRE
jgi:WD40 repeat protein